MKSFSILILPALCLLLANCATITRGSTDTLNVTSNPSNADVVIKRTDKDFSKKERKKNKSLLSEGGTSMRGVTPAVFVLQRAGDYDVTVSKEGFKPSTARVTHKTSVGGGAGMAGNVLLGGIVGGAVDVGTGATQNLTPNPLHVELER